MVHPDEPRVVARSMRMLAEGDMNPHFFTYPSLYLYFLSLCFALLGILTWPLHLVGVVPDLFSWYREVPVLFHLIGRIANGVLGGITPVVVCLAGVRLFGSWPAGLAAAAAVALNPLHVEESHFATTDVPATLLAALSFFFAIGIYRTGSLRDYLLAGALAGLAAGTKYPAGLVVLAIPVAAALRAGGVRDAPFGSGAGEGGTPSGAGERATEYLPLAGGSGFSTVRLAAGILAFINAFFLSTPFAALDARSFLDDLLTEWIATRAGILGATIRDPLYYVLPPDPPLGFGMLGLMAGILGAVLLGRKQADAVPMLLSASLPLLAVMSASSIKIDRYVLPAVPALSLLIGYAIAAPLLSPRMALPVLRWAAVLCLGTVVLLAPATESLSCTAPLAAADPRGEARRWMAAHLPPGAVVGVPPHGWMTGTLPASVLAVALPHVYDDRVRERVRWEQTAADHPIAGALVSVLLPRRVHTPEMAERRLAELPSIEGSGPPSLEGINGVYLLESSAFVELYQGPYTGREYPAATVAWTAFFEEVRRRGEPVGEWRSETRACASFLRAPDLRLWRL